MSSYSNYKIVLSGEEASLSAAKAYLDATYAKDPYTRPMEMGDGAFGVEQDYKHGWMEGLEDLAKGLAKAAPALASFEISGRIEDETCGENMDFLFRYNAGVLTMQESEWCNMDFWCEGPGGCYEDFCEYVECRGTGKTYTREEYEALMEGNYYPVWSIGHGITFVQVGLGEPQIVSL